MDAVDKRRKSPGGPKGTRRKGGKNGLKIKEEKMGDGVGNSMGDLHEQSGVKGEHLLNGNEMKLENPPTPQHLHDSKNNLDSLSDIPPLSDLSHPDFPDCKPQMSPYCYPQYSNVPNSSMPPHPGDYGLPPHMLSPYGPPPPPPQQPTKQQPTTLEAQYMQQQSQIFVFSTKLANKAADAVFQGQFPSIIAFHTSQFATRKFLEYQGNPNWSNPPPGGGKMPKGAKGSQGQGPIGPPPPNMQQQQQQQQQQEFNNMHQGHPPPSSPCNMYNQHMKSSPQQQGYGNYYESGPPGSCGGPMGSGNNISMGGGPPYFTGIKIPDSDLTPEQRHHREEQLAKLRKIQQVFIPDTEQPGTPGDPHCHPIHPHESMNEYNMPPGGGPPGMDYGMSNKPPGCGEWGGGGGQFYMESPHGGGMKQGGNPPLHPPPPSSGNGPRKGGSIPSPATPLTPSSSSGAPHRPSPHSPLSGNEGLFGGGGGSHPFYASGSSGGYFSPQIESSPAGRKDSESGSSEGGGGGSGNGKRREKSSSSLSPPSSAPPSEANLMPVPSPQQIQYLSTFEGQELTILKQPNMGLGEGGGETSPGGGGNGEREGTPGKPSHSAPPTPLNGGPKSGSDGSGKTRPGSVGPVPTPKGSSSTPAPSPGLLDRSSQPGTPLTLSMMEMKSSSTFMSSSSGPSGCILKSGMGLELDGPSSSGGPNGPPGGVYDNVPLNPNLAGPPPPGPKGGFDPISSMVQMSQQIGGNGSPNAPGSGGGYGMNSGPPHMNPNLVNFNTSMHNVQNIEGGIGMGGPQTVNNTYVNATMTIQQMNIQNMPPYMGGGGQGGGGGGGGPSPGNSMPPHPMSLPHMGGHMGGAPPNMQGMPLHAPMGPSMSPGMPMGQMCRGGGGQMVYGGHGQGGGGQRMGGRGSPYRMPPGPRAFGGANVQVKPNAPNTIQYLPARPPPPHNQSQMCSGGGGMGGGGGRSGPNLDFLQRYTNPSPGPAVNVNMGINVNVGGMGGGRMPYPGPPPQGMMGGNVRMGGGGPQMMMDGGQGPPNMMGGRGGPSGPKGPDDPVYLQQFHHFQQSLYSTGSSGPPPHNGNGSASINSNNGRAPPNMGPSMQQHPSQPPPPPNQQYFK